MKKHLPKMKTDEEVEKFLEGELSDYLNQDNFKPVNFEFVTQENTITIPVSSQLMAALKVASQQQGISYHQYIQELLEKAVQEIK